jgi:hypothetical protein
MIGVPHVLISAQVPIAERLPSLAVSLPNGSRTHQRVDENVAEQDSTSMCA